MSVITNNQHQERELPFGCVNPWPCDGSDCQLAETRTLNLSWHTKLRYIIKFRGSPEPFRICEKCKSELRMLQEVRQHLHYSTVRVSKGIIQILGAYFGETSVKLPSILDNPAKISYS